MDKPEEGRPARFVCPHCGVGDHLYTRVGQSCVYCGKSAVADRLRYLIRRILGTDDRA